MKTERGSYNYSFGISTHFSFDVNSTNEYNKLKIMCLVSLDKILKLHNFSENEFKLIYNYNYDA